MDPDQTLADGLAALARMHDDMLDSNQRQEAAETAAFALQDLHNWISKGGFLPADWTKGQQ